MVTWVFLAVVAGLELFALVAFVRGFRAGRPEAVAASVGRLGAVFGLIILAALIATVAGLGLAFEAVAPPEHRARVVASGISEAMNFGPYALVALVPVALGLVLLKRRQARLSSAAQV